ncbi:MAG: AI-2E family transporter [Nitrospira sp.]|nr:AI-2E family transporter [Nitrospira sp.]
MNEEEKKTLDATSRFMTVVFLAGLGYLLFSTFQPYLSALVWSAVLSYGLYPQYCKIVELTGQRRSLSAFIMSLGVTVGFLLPLAYLSFLIGKELASTYLMVVSLLENRPSFLDQWLAHPWVSGLVEQMQEFQRMTGTDPRTVLVDNLAELGGRLVQQLTHVAGNILFGLIELGIVLLSTFYFFRDGANLIEWVKDLLPLERNHQQMLFLRFHEVVRGAVFGNTLIAAFEGILGGLAFWFVGLPSPLLWGAVMGVLAYLPFVGAGIIWMPAALILFLKGDYTSGVVLCVAGTVIAILDYVVRTLVVGGASKLHTLLTFFAVLGGIRFFGLVGIVAGPLVVAVSFALLDSYRAQRSAVRLTGTEP